MTKPSNNPKGRPPSQEYKDLAQQLDISTYSAKRIGKHELRRLLAMDESSRKLVFAPKPGKQHKPAMSVEYLMFLASRSRRA